MIDTRKRDAVAIDQLERVVAKHGTQAAAAKALHISQAHISDLLAGRRNFTDGMLAKLGLRRTIIEKAS